MKALSVIELMDLFGTDKIAEDWFITARWPDGLRCAYCKGDRVAERGNHPTQRFHCLDCMKFFSVKTNSVMHSSKLGYRKWAIAIYMFMTHPKGVSSYQLHRNIGITQKTAWHLAHRIRKALETDTLEMFIGPVEVDETFMGGKARNQTFERKMRMRKTPVIGMRDRATNKVRATVMERLYDYMMQGFIYAHTHPDAVVHTDQALGYQGVNREHHTVNHTAREYGPTNGIESLWAIFKRAQMGVYHKMSPKHLHRYVAELQERHNRRPMEIIERMTSVVSDGEDKRLRYEDLIAGGKPYS